MPVANMGFSALDHAMMARAIQVAEQGRATATPNPFVGCVIVKHGRVIGEGFTRSGGRPHAEADALERCTESPAGATVYVTLEPCALHPDSRGPACSDLLIAAKVGRVVSALHDPYDGVDGRGHANLLRAGVTLETGLMAAAVRQQLRAFLHRVEHGRPFVTLKVAASIDGRTALASGESKWISSAEARRDVHLMRRDACAVLTGIGTVIADNPQLTARDVGCERQPRRILLDSRLDVSDSHHVLADKNVLVVTATGSADREQQLHMRGIRVLRAPVDARNGKVDLQAMMQQLGGEKLNALMVETGAKLNGSLLSAGVVDEIVAYLAPSILGDDARGLFAIPSLASLRDKIALQFTNVRQIGPDLKVTMKVKE
jgi:diaminohydroxyphosphoribosylaminopyrimidine deaminase / 5-amino-6-(5-phosphoribosylamino)uracil reductase